MGQSNSSECATDTASDKARAITTPCVAASIANFLGIFYSKQDEIIDSTDSEITLDDSGTGRSLNSKEGIGRLKTSFKQSRESHKRDRRNSRSDIPPDAPPRRSSDIRSAHGERGSVRRRSSSRTDRHSRSSDPLGNLQDHFSNRGVRGGNKPSDTPDNVHNRSLKSSVGPGNTPDKVEGAPQGADSSSNRLCQPCGRPINTSDKVEDASHRLCQPCGRPVNIQNKVDNVPNQLGNSSVLPVNTPDRVENVSHLLCRQSCGRPINTPNKVINSSHCLSQPCCRTLNTPNKVIYSSHSSSQHCGRPVNTSDKVENPSPALCCQPCGRPINTTNKVINLSHHLCQPCGRPVNTVDGVDNASNRLGRTLVRPDNAPNKIEREIDRSADKVPATKKGCAQVTANSVKNRVNSYDKATKELFVSRGLGGSKHRDAATRAGSLRSRVNIRSSNNKQGSIVDCSFEVKPDIAKSCVTFGAIEKINDCLQGTCISSKTSDATSNCSDSTEVCAATSCINRPSRKLSNNLSRVNVKNCPIHGSGSLNNQKDFCSTHFHENAHEVMQDYQQYSREPPERDQDLTDCAVSHNMKSCGRNCCLSCTKKIEAQPCNNKVAQCNPHRIISKFASKPVKPNYCGNRSSSERYVNSDSPSCVKKEKVNPSLSKSAPIHIQPGRTYPSASRVASDQRPRIPLPPPPPVKLHDSSKLERRSKFNNRERNPQPIPNSLPSSTENNKQMYNPNNYNYSKHHYKNPYPYEEPGDSTAYSHDTSCSNNCNGYDHCPQHRSCKCHCHCEPDNYYQRQLSDEQLSCSSDSTKTDFMNLAYQRTGDYPELVDELENTLSQRNRMRVQKTMQQFEILSRQNKNLDKPIFDDEESHHNCRNHCHHGKRNHRTECSGNEPNESRRPKYHADAAQKRPSFPSNSVLPRKSGYVEKVARYMDPKLNDKMRNRTSPPRPYHQKPNPNVNGNGTWQMDARKGEWVKVNPRQNQYDFESNYPPLPPRPRSCHPYDDRPSRHDYPDGNPHMECPCNKCSRQNR